MKLLRYAAATTLPVCFWVLFAICSGDSFACPQNKIVDKTLDRLKIPIDLHLNGVTLSEILPILSKQTHVTIKASTSLQDRILTVHIAHLPAVDVLDSLSELNGWKWYVADTNCILITRARPALPITPETVAARIQSAIPKDLNDFLIACDFNAREDSDAPRKAKITGREDVSQLSETSSNITRALSAKYRQWIDQLRATLDLKQLRNKPLRYNQMTAQQRRLIVGLIVLHALEVTDGLLLHGNYYASSLNPANITISMNGPDALTIGTRQVIDGRLILHGMVLSIPSTEEKQPR